MVAVDTNVVVRLLTADHPSQFKKAKALFDREAVFVPESVVLETEWVLRAAYSLTPADVCEGLRRVFGLPNVRLSDAAAVALAIDWHERGLDFADAMHLAQSSDCSSLKTFDARFARRATALKVGAVERL